MENKLTVCKGCGIEFKNPTGFQLFHNWRCMSEWKIRFYREHPEEKHVFLRKDKRKNKAGK